MSQTTVTTVLTIHMTNLH